MSVPKLNKDSLLKNKYIIVKQLGKGAFGAVYEAFNLQTEESVAIKAVNKTSLRASPKVRQLFDSEVHLLQKI